MAGIFFLLSLIALLIGIIALIKGSIKKFRIHSRKSALGVIGASFLLFIAFVFAIDNTEDAAEGMEASADEQEEVSEESEADNENNNPETAEEEAAENNTEENSIDEEIVEESTEENAPAEEESEEEFEFSLDPIQYSGSGDDVILIETPADGPVILNVKANEEGRHFSITGYDDSDNRTTLFVNTTDPYEGITLDPGGTTTLLEISANGPWEIETLNLWTLRSLSSPGKIEGTGDDVILVSGDPSLASIQGNSSERHFAVIGYNPSRNLMVNTTDAYEGRVRVDSGTSVLEITGVGDWSIEME